MIQVIAYTCGICGFHCEGPETSKLMEMHPKLCQQLTKQDLTQLYDFIGRQALPYDNDELKNAVDKLQKIVETPATENELDK